METLCKPQNEIKMNTWSILNIINGNTIQVKPAWTWNNVTGDKVRINGYTIYSQSLPAQAADDIAKGRLNTLLAGKSFILSNPTHIENDTIYCDIYLNGINIVNYFPDFKKP